MLEHWASPPVITVFQIGRRDPDQRVRPCSR